MKSVVDMKSFLSRVFQLLCLVGESFDEASEDVCGAVVNVRPKGDKIAIWTSNCQNREAIMTIGWEPTRCKLSTTRWWHCIGTNELSLRLSPCLNRQQYKERLNIPIKAMIGYQSHDDTSSKSGSTTKNMYSVWTALWKKNSPPSPCCRSKQLPIHIITWMVFFELSTTVVSITFYWGKKREWNCSYCVQLWTPPSPNTAVVFKTKQGRKHGRCYSYTTAGNTVSILE